MDTYFFTLNDFPHTVSEENKLQTVIFAKYIFTCIYLQKKMSKRKYKKKRKKKENTVKCLQQLSKNGGILGDFNFMVLLFYHFHTINMDIL